MREPRLPRLLESGAQGRRQNFEHQNNSAHVWLPQADLPNVVALPIANLRRRPMRPAERSLVVGLWWRLRGEGVDLPAEPGVIVLDGGRR